jgi:hypothetical protein
MFFWRIHITIPQDRTSFQRNRYVVPFLAKSDPLCFVDVDGESSSAWLAVFAGLGFVDGFDAAPLWIGKDLVV